MEGGGEGRKGEGGGRRGGGRGEGRREGEGEEILPLAHVYAQHVVMLSHVQGQGDMSTCMQ